MKRFSTKALCRAGVIAALYVALVYALMGLSSGAIQFRPSEALTLLPLLFPESVPALLVGCLLGNLTSPFGIWDILLGSCVTLLAAAATFAIGKFIKPKWAKVLLGGLPPVLLNAFILPLIWMLFGPLEYMYLLQCGYLIVSQAISVYLIGIPLYFAIDRLKSRGLSVFDNAPVGRKSRPAKTPEKPADVPPVDSPSSDGDKHRENEETSPDVTEHDAK